jgi:hypothetical protein
VRGEPDRTGPVSLARAAARRLSNSALRAAITTNQPRCAKGVSHAHTQKTADSHTRTHLSPRIVSETRRRLRAELCPRSPPPPPSARPAPSSHAAAASPSPQPPGRRLSPPPPCACPLAPAPLPCPPRRGRRRPRWRRRRTLPTTSRPSSRSRSPRTPGTEVRSQHHCSLPCDWNSAGLLPRFSCVTSTTHLVVTPCVRTWCFALIS